jgi:hypothetical protein
MNGTCSLHPIPHNESSACEDWQPAENILQEADRITSTTRPSDHGHPKEQLPLAAALWSPILGIEVTPEQVALCMVQLKVSRYLARPKRDDLVDICGWTRTIERLEE